MTCVAGGKVRGFRASRHITKRQLNLQLSSNLLPTLTAEHILVVSKLAFADAFNTSRIVECVGGYIRIQDTCEWVSACLRI